MERSFLSTPQEVLAHFGVTEDAGLPESQVAKNREKYGSNALEEEPPTPLWQLILEQFKDQLVIILLGSAVVSFVLALFEEGEGWTAFVDPIVILTILVLNAIVGVSQESSAEKAIAALQEYSANEAKVVRDGAIHRIKAEELVPGDIISVAVGDRVPADCRLLTIQSNSFRVDQAILTGESQSVSKTTNAIQDPQAVKQDQINLIFSGTTVVTGHATAIVVLTGASTAIGDIHESITAQISEPTPLKQKLNNFGDSLAKVITVICILVWLINIEHFGDPSHGSWAKGAIYYLKIAVSLGVAAIPEGLAVVITTCLALGTRKMAAKNAVVRSLPSVETLGSCSVICSDKTGTLTTNQMSVSRIVYLNEAGNGLEEIEVEGTTFAPHGDLKLHGKVLKDLAASSATIQQMTEVMALCNEAELAYDTKTGTFSNIGEPTEEEYEKLEQDMTLIGLVAMLDPPRPEVRASIEKCREAGIRVIVITGDNQHTAESICRQIGIFGKNEDLRGKSFTGREFDELSEQGKLEAAKNGMLFSRTEPTHKSKLVDLLQSIGHVVAMTGDGVNDAPALKKSDIGVAMGSGTDVAKLAADMVLADDNFATIEVAIEEGRSIYSNTQQFIRYLISSNIGEVVSIFLTAALGMPEALVPVQLLWVNLVTDGLPATALSFNPADHDIMRRPPRKRDEPLVGGWLFFRYMVIGIYVGAATVFGYACRIHNAPREFSEIGCDMFTNDMSKSASTISLSILVVIEMLNAMNALSSSESLFTFPLWNNMMLVYAIMLSMSLHFAILYIPFLQSLFNILPLNWLEWKAVLVISAPVIVIDELLKYIERALYVTHVTPSHEAESQNGSNTKPKAS
ncbi:calcium-transporting ATPase [Trichophyton equinum CBS 127.97]|uniref:P-type Ca(2+) transporter n=1 Tax=Trichophyton equinum (strain ATCC MYA-4606 / CBS 127.97) TaxID=559882 RepID=F2PVW9_TRIEC|nr:calcium-transporting ATPase [Trichophyton equinum CBS 127.97]